LGKTQEQVQKQEVYVYFTRSKSILARLFRWFEKSDVSHVGLGYNNQSFGNNDWYIESNLKGVLTFPAGTFNQNITHRFRCEHPKVPEALMEISKLVMTPYDLKSAFFIGLGALIFKFLNVKIKRPLNNSKGQVCSEMVSRFFDYLTLNGIHRYNFETVTPQELHDYCLEYPQFFKRVDL